MSLKGHLALVTGSTSGIGLGIATSLADAGANLAINGFGPDEEIQKILGSLRAKNVKAEFVSFDVSDAEKVEEGIKKAKEIFGQPVDILVNNAGIQFTSPTEDFPVEKFDQIIKINMSSNFYAIKAVLPDMKAQNWGRIINISSAHGKVASANKIAYVAAKHGVLGMTKVVALETAKTGITCNAICPGWVLTPLVETQIRKRAAENETFEVEKKKLLEEKQPSGDFVKIEDLGAMVVFLCSEAGANIRGSDFSMDGGWTAQ
ncbi:Oidioi.mRNA.OKI2018_I69.chr2.g4418.t1.cds [Oikopleura dioica]|uniref:3-oxoacyl-[acyl-carrier-protein] reductase n=1 Tax=Oikopleura dioica TaxID=34765 RepID=A0ABN7T3V7_OIKDI|nr:Oidioi.mRNA.OKI2018_I69.chr2.g4418.t1.cds [Oikopleura dioica]